MSDTKLIHYESNGELVIRNQLLESCFKLDVSEWRLLLAFAASLNTSEYIDSKNKYSLSVNDFGELLSQFSRQEIYRSIKRAVESLYNRTVVLYEERSNAKLHFRFIQEVFYLPDEERITYRLSERMAELFSYIQDNFTVIDLMVVMRFRSSYSYHFYLWFKRFLDEKKGHGSRVMTVEDIRQKLALGDQYQDIQNLRRRVIEVAVNEINAIGDMNVKFEPVRRGRKIVSFQFTYHRKTEKQLEKVSKGLKAPDSPNLGELSQKLQPVYQPTETRFSGMSAKKIKLMMSLAINGGSVAIAKQGESMTAFSNACQRELMKMAAWEADGHKLLAAAPAIVETPAIARGSGAPGAPDRNINVAEAAVDGMKDILRNSG